MLDQISQLSRRHLDPLAAAAIGLLILLAVPLGGDGDGDRSPAGEGGSLRLLASEATGSPEKPRQCLRPERLREAKRWADDRAGSIGFAFYDECGRLVGVHRNRIFPSASVVKVMLLAAYLRQGDVADRTLNAGERDLLGAMITMSDNKAADQVFATVGETGLTEVAEAAGMSNFVPSTSWGGSGITAADQAEFFGGLERYIPKRHEGYAAGLFGSIIPGQVWSIPEVKPKGWQIGFKGGWYLAPEGWRVNQVARLTKGRRSFALAVLTGGNASFQYGRETIAGIAKRLMGDYPR